MNIETKYYALLDPADAGRMTYWRRTKNDTLTSWPASARHEPRLLKKDVPAGLRGVERNEWIRNWYDRNVRPWWAAIIHAVDNGPDECAARFAALTSCCCVCGRALTDAESKAYGIGPDCRRGASPDLLAWFAEAMGRAHAKALAASGVKA